MGPIIGDSPLLSVVVPVYNAERTLSDCIDRILSQSYKNIEVLLINDGSTDHSAEICSHFKALYPDIVTYIYQDNCGPATARNRGIESSRGKYVAFVDADDHVCPEIYEAMLAELEKTNAEMAICAYWLIHGEDRRMITYNLPEGLYCNNECKQIAVSVLNEDGNCIPPFSWVRITAKSVFTTSGLRFQDGLVRSEDFHFWLKVQFLVKSVCLLSQTPLYEYIENSQSITHTHVQGYWDDVCFIYHDLYVCLPQEKTIQEGLDMMLIRRAMIALNNACYSKSFRIAKKEICSVLNSELLLDAIVRTNEISKTERFRSFRKLMTRNKGNMIKAKYYFRWISCKMAKKH